LDKAPVGLGATADPLQPHLPQSKIDPDPVALQQYANRVEVAQNPAVVFDRIKDGSLTPEHVETLKAVYPALVPQYQSALMEAIQDSKHPIPYEVRHGLGMLLDVPTTYENDGNLGRIQAGFAPLAPEQSGLPQASVQPMGAGTAKRLIESYSTPIGGASL
jgi:hypothetical protein